jgi:hypothetical protein
MSDLLNQASLVMVPSGYKEDTVYSAIPTDGSGDLSFTRASNGTRVNSAGLVEVCPWNLVQNSEQYSAGTWGLAFLSISTDSAVAPNGTTTADLLYPPSSQAYCYVSTTSFSVVAGQTYTQSVYLKRSGFRWGIVDNMAGSPGAWFDLLNGVVGTVASGCTAFIESVGNGWYRCSVSSVAQAGTNYADFRMSDTNGGSAVTANGSDGLLAWGFQLNIGSTAKPYFPTTDRLNVPRLTYQNGGGGCPSLLLEKQSTNYLKYSNDFTQSVWSASGSITRTANYAVSPDGTQTATRIQWNGTDGELYQYLGQTTPTRSSVYVKGTAGQVINFCLNLITLTGEWQRIEAASLIDGSDTWFGIITKSSVGHTATDFLLWGGQGENGTYATSLIYTTSASVTRVADACYKTGISSLIGQTEGTLFADFVITGLESLYGTAISVNDGVANNYVWLTIFANGNLRAEVWNGSVQASITYSGAVVGSRYKMAFGYKTNDFVLYVNGTQVGTDNSGTTFSGTTLSRVDNNLAGVATNNVSQSLNQWEIFPTRLTNAQLVELTTI